MDRSIKQMQKDFYEIKKRSMVDGILWRAAYTREDAAVKEYLAELMESKGFQVSQDAVGNLLGTVEGRRRRNDFGWFASGHCEKRR